VACVLSELPAQPLRQERRIVARHAELVGELWQDARALAAPAWQQVDDALLTSAARNPFAPIAQAQAAYVGEPYDDAFGTRALVYVNALPEVVDPLAFEDAGKTTPYRLHVTLHTPLRLVESRPLTFLLTLRDAASKTAWTGTVGPKSAEDVALFAATMPIPVAGLPDGAYVVEVRTQLGDDLPRAHDPTARARVLVQRGFAARARELSAQLAAALVPAPSRSLTAGDRAALLGAYTVVQRVYGGEADDGTLDLGADLRHAEAVLANVVAERPALHGIAEFVTLAVALAAGPAPHQPKKFVRVRLRPPAASDTLVAAPLVLFQVGSPTWDGALARPLGARTMPAGFLTRALVHAGFDREANCACAVMDSDGDLDHPTAAVGEVLEALESAAPIDRSRVVLVGEREAAATMLAAARHSCLPHGARGIVCVAGGALSPVEMDFLAHTHVLLVPARGHPSGENQRRLVQFARAAGHGERVAVLEPARAWLWALPCALPAIEAFCRERLR
jgi:hypothetical protein